MASNPPVVVSKFPAPPPFYKLYESYKKDVPFEEQPNILPPPKPVLENYTTFGNNYTTQDALPSLEEQGRTRLYPEDFVPVEELKKLNRSILFTYLELLDVLINNPEHYKTKVEHLELLFVNMHHLMNGYRPHQARDTLIVMLEDQIQRRKQESQELESRLQKTRELLQTSVAQLQNTDNHMNTNESNENNISIEIDNSVNGNSKTRNNGSASNSKSNSPSKNTIIEQQSETDNIKENYSKLREILDNVSD
eukprot:TRINITY_DN2215_c0_g1_i4.p1 TRINITY_DN2215_c0_g1~~TRINITY_DN2215_c0_g1_i4.p1  ORF type:complete len:251 (-),score=55.05 TRINITY_DN2215_c0_g1_i4:456-1208(-)